MHKIKKPSIVSCSSLVVLVCWLYDSTLNLSGVTVCVFVSFDYILTLCFREPDNSAQYTKAILMDEIQDVVNSIIKGCSHGGIEVSDVLAAFIAKTVMEYLSYVFVFTFISNIAPHVVTDVPSARLMK